MKLRLEDAYGLGEEGNHKAYYDEQAKSYDDEFAVPKRYIYPALVGNRYLELAGKADRPVADLGCGTGLIGNSFAGKNCPIDGLDVSPGMLREAARKRVYRNLLEVDLTVPVEGGMGSYGGLVSCGTFTLGHLGPSSLEMSLCHGRVNALCVIGINSLHFENEGFTALFERLSDSEQITETRFEFVPIYEKVVSVDPVNLGKLAIFRIGKPK